MLHAYIPDIHGKEKRKKQAGKEGLLGVEGMDEDIILDALKKAGCEIDGTSSEIKRGRDITKADLYRLGLSGGADSKTLRHDVSKELGLPMKLSANMLLDMLNRLLDYNELEELTEHIKTKKQKI